ncbi:hypothetical protein [Nocardioides sp. R-C-SC26]|uniref:hypothetical protein n=1 Tax=Nocardioides sp. R-C-SC26 TaxID=2870414 RepID=UPI001E5BB1EF|nr:hypothetical protein [Nocardioides sp. R-C-SC26]
MSGLHLEPTAENAVAISALRARARPASPHAVVEDRPRRLRRSWAPGRLVDRAWAFDLHDQRDRRWWPQGITTSDDGRHIAVAWYAKALAGDPEGGHGSRISLIDVVRRRYRHVLLVTPRIDDDGIPSFTPLRTHAGGLAWQHGHLHVAATRRGLHTARINDILRLPDDGPLTELAGGYRYVLPIIRSYRAGAAADAVGMRYSFLSADRERDELLAGEYATSSSDAPRRLVRLALDPASGLPAVGEDGRSIALALGEGVGHMQGAVCVGSRLVVSTSRGTRRRGSLWTGAMPANDVGSLALTELRAALPMGPEDLAHDDVSGALWSVSEHPWRRWLVRLRDPLGG